MALEESEMSLVHIVAAVPHSNRGTVDPATAVPSTFWAKTVGPDAVDLLPDVRAPHT